MTVENAQVGVAFGTTGGEQAAEMMRRLTKMQGDLAQQIERQRQVTSGLIKQQRGLAAANEAVGRSTVGLANKTTALAASFGLLAGGVGPATGAVDAFGTAMAAASEKAVASAKAANKLPGLFAKITGQIGAMAPQMMLAAAAGMLLQQAIIKIADSTNKLDEAQRAGLKQDFSNFDLGANAGTKQVDLGKVADKVRAANAEFERFNVHSVTWGDAMAARAQVFREIEGAVASFTTKITEAGKAEQRHTEVLVSAFDKKMHGVSVYALTNEQIKEGLRLLEAEVAAYVEAGKVVPESLQKKTAEVHLWAKAMGLIPHGWHTAAQASAEFEKSQASLAERMDILNGLTKLSTEGQIALLEEFVAVEEKAKELGKTIGDDLSREMKELGLTSEEAREKLEKLKGGLGGDWTSSIKTAMDKALADQTAKWKKEQDERAAYEKKSIADVTAEYTKKWGFAIDESAVYWNTQFDKAAVSMVARTKGLLATAGSAMAAMLNRSGGSGGGAARSGGGGSSSSDDAEDESISRAKEIRDRMAARQRKIDELNVIQRRFSKKGGYNAEVEKRKAEIAEMDDEIDKLKGGKGNKFKRAHAGLLAEKEDRDVLKLAKDIRTGNRDQKRAADGIQRAVGKLQQVVATQQQTAAATTDLRDLARRSGMTQAEMARYLAGMAARSTLPSTRSVYQGGGETSRSGGRSTGPKTTGKLGSASPLGSNS